MGGPDPRRALEKYRGHAAGYDRRIGLTAPLRRRAVQRLRLAPGETCVDVACGTGINFALIEERVGPAGRVLGLDLSPDMLARARSRVDRAGWENVTLVEGSVEEARLPAPADAFLFSLTHDVLQMPDGLANLFAQARPGARVALFGPKLGSGARAFVNPVVRAMARPYVTTLDGLDRPWRHVERHVDELTVRPVLLGGAYVAWGTLAGA